MKVLALAFAILALAAGTARDADDSALKEVNGVWLMTSAQLGGANLPAEAIKSMKLALSGGKYVLTNAEGAD